ncbi:unnamed protein product [Ectocarpus sp. 4 AP-2014]
MMVSVIGQDEEVEEASFMPRAFRRSDDNAMRKWEARDVAMKAIDAEIGGGTFARVVFGQTSIGMPVAIKVINRDSDAFGSQARADKYINREIQTLTMAAHHPNVVDILGTLKIPSTTFMIMPLLHSDVATLLKERPLQEKEAVTISIQMFSAVEHVHSKGILHRDLKPANLLITNDMQVRLADFGFSKMLAEGETTMTGLCGTKPYLSPEQVNKLPYGIEADMWAAGVVVSELLMGITVFCPDPSIDLGPVSKDISSLEEGGDIRMRLDPYDELERENIRAGVFKVDSERVGAVGENFLRKLIVLDPAERMSARQAGEHPWLGDEGAVMLKRAEVEAVLKEAQETEQAEKNERMKFLRSKRRRRVPKVARVARSLAPVAEGALQPTSSTAGAVSMLTSASMVAATAAGADVPRAMMVAESGSTAVRSSDGEASGSGAGVAQALIGQEL